MRGIKPVRGFWASVACLLGLGIAAILLVSPVMAQIEGAVGESTVADMTPASEPTLVPTSDSSTGGIVGDPPPTDPAPTEPVRPEETPDGTEGMPTEEPREEPTAQPDNEGIAPAVVVVVLVTADGGPVSDRTTVCVSEMCQPVGAVRSGTEIEFERIVQGWHDISVFDAGAYEDGFSSVAVRPGQLHTVEVILAVSRRVEETPTPQSNGPIRSPIVVTDRVDENVVAVDRDEPLAGDSEPQASFANVTAGEDAAVLRITSLPSTGAGDSERGVASLTAMTLGAAVFLAAGAAIRRRAAQASRSGRLSTARLP
ncbi:MAG: hypothetical protein H0T72_14335 [Chloroflexia bacterium]|nr:hypothetical protein [Chloroflexia bacterium]